MDAEPTPQHIAAALLRAKHTVETRDVDVITALAEATTTAQCHGVQGFKVFRDTRYAVEVVTGSPLSVFVTHANRKRSAAVLQKAITNIEHQQQRKEGE